jgi:hypothetical protein
MAGEAAEEATSAAAAVGQMQMPAVWELVPAVEDRHTPTASMFLALSTLPAFTPAMATWFLDTSMQAQRNQASMFPHTTKILKNQVQQIQNLNHQHHHNQSPSNQIQQISSLHQ